MTCVAFGQLVDELMGVCRLRGSLDVFLRCTGSTVANVVTYVAGKQGRLLWHQSDVLSKLSETQLSDVSSIQGDTP